MKINNKYLLSIFSLLVLVLYQNCGDVSLAPKKEEVTTPTAVYTPKGDFCPSLGPGYGSPAKFLFVLDMSASNYGGIKATYCSDHTCVWDIGANINPSDDPYINRDMVTDLEGHRFDVTRDFILATEREGQEYGVLGFSTSFLNPTDISAGCINEMVEGEEARSHVEGLRAIQAADIAMAPESASAYESPFRMKNTSYYSSLMCLHKKIRTDLSLSQEAEREYYYIFFLTDGKPTDYADPCGGLPNQQAIQDCRDENPELNNPALAACASQYSSCNTSCNNSWQQCTQPAGVCEHNRQVCQSNCQMTFQSCAQQIYSEVIYNQKLNAIKQDVQLANGGIRFLPIYYGLDGEQTEALQVLNSMASTVNVNDTAQSVSDIGEIQAAMQSVLEVQATVNYRVYSFAAINLTAKMDGNTLKADSDMDGLTDELEDSLAEQGLAFSATHARSSGIFDGICYSLGGQGCTPPPEACSSFNAFGLNVCDLEAASGLYGRVLSGLDTDNDFMPDFIELIRGTNPNLQDMSIDSDGDGFNNLQEIVRGLDTQKNNLNQYPVPSSAELKARFNERQSPASGCVSPQKTYSFSIDNLPLVSTRAYQHHAYLADNTIFNLSHAEDENVILVYFIVEPMGSASLPRKLYATILKVPYLGIVSESAVTVTPDEFKLVGEIAR